MDENVENSAQNDQTPPEPETTDSSQTQEVSQNSKNMAVLCHLLGYFTLFIGPLILWLIKKDEDPFVDDQGKEALNFQVTVTIACIVGILLSMICIGILLLAVIGIADLVFVIVACVKSGKGQAYRYPVSIRLIK